MEHWFQDEMAVRTVVNEMLARDRTNRCITGKNAEQVMIIVANALESVRAAPQMNHDWRWVFTMIFLNVYTPEYGDAICKILPEKGKAYGVEPIIRWGALGVVIRIDSKWSRFQNLYIGAGTDTVKESLVDTLVDILGYSILGYYLVTHHQRSSVR